MVVGVVGRGQRRNAINKQKNIQPGKLTYIGNWYWYIGQKNAETPTYGFVGKITARPTSFKTCK
jgi:hypothetical protein